MESGTTKSAHGATSVHLKSRYDPGTSALGSSFVGREVPPPRFTEEEVGCKEVTDLCEQAPGWYIEIQTSEHQADHWHILLQ